MPTTTKAELIELLLNSEIPGTSVMAVQETENENVCQLGWIEPGGEFEQIVSLPKRPKPEN